MSTMLEYDLNKPWSQHLVDCVGKYVLDLGAKEPRVFEILGWVHASQLAQTPERPWAYVTVKVAYGKPGPKPELTKEVNLEWLHASVTDALEYGLRSAQKRISDLQREITGTEYKANQFANALEESRKRDLAESLKE